MTTVVGTLGTKVALVRGTDWMSCSSKGAKATIMHRKSVRILKSWGGSFRGDASSEMGYRLDT